MLPFRAMLLALLGSLNLAAVTPIFERATTSRPVELKELVYDWCSDARLNGIFSGKSAAAGSAFEMRVAIPTRIAVEDCYQSECTTSGEVGPLLCRPYFT